MSEKAAFDRESVQKTLDQLEQTLKVMGAVVSRLRDHLACAGDGEPVQVVKGTVVVEGKGTVH